MKADYTVHVMLDAGVFRRFCVFDALILRRKWLRPILFALIMAAFAVVALISRRPQSGLIAGVLLAVGLGLPVSYFGTFLWQVSGQVRRYSLKTPQRVYTVHLDGKGVSVVNDQRKEPPLSVNWADVQSAFRDGGCIYLYVNAARAFLLPDGQANVEPDVLWAYLESQLGARARRVRQLRQ